MKLISNFSNKIAAGLEIDQPESFRSHIVRFFRLLGIPVLAYFSIQDLYERHWDESVFTLAILGVFILTTRLDINASNSKNFFRVGMGMLAVNFIYLLAVNADTYLLSLWMYLIPLPVALLFGVKEGSAWIFTSWLGAFAVISFSPLHPPVPTEYILRFGFTYATLGMLSLSAEYVRENTQRLYLKKQSELTLLNEKISGKMLMDPLTGGYNRGFMIDLLPGMLTYAAEAQIPLSIILCDIDEFKEINDSHGHIIGDEIIKETAAILLNNLRNGTDHLVRYGGDEFLIVLRNTSVEDAAKLAERLRKRTLEQAFSKKNLRLTCSYGVAELEALDFFGSDKDALNRLIGRADRCLYQAKHQGKNKVVSTSSL